MKTLPISAVLAAALVTISLSACVHAADHTKDPLPVVKKRVEEKKAILIDVREQSEWDAGHLAAAKLIPLSKIRDGKITEKQLEKDKIIYCHCRSGGRVLLATDILKKQGYDIRPLKQGYADLVKAGFAKAD